MPRIKAYFFAIYRQGEGKYKQANNPPYEAYLCKLHLRCRVRAVMGFHEAAHEGCNNIA